MDNARKNFIVNPEFQYKFSGLILVPIIFLSALIPYTMNDALTTLIEMIQKNYPSIAQNAMGIKQQYMLVIIIFEIIFGISTFFVCVLVSHRVAGSIYKAQKFLKEIKNGDNPPELKFRELDYFQDLATDINDAVKALRSGNENPSSLKEEILEEMKKLEEELSDDKLESLRAITKKLQLL